MIIKNHIPILLLLACCWATATAQQVDIGAIGKGKPFKISGGLAASSVLYGSSQNTGREAFTFFLQGNLNLNFYQFSMPVSYSYTNQGSQLGFELPFKFNRLSLHPKYKWVQAHMGDVAMGFSPYTLNNHQFTGAGVDLTPKGAVTLSAMAGRLLRATEDDGNPLTVPAFSRMGYGLKVGYKKEKWHLGAIGFYAKDDQNSIAPIADPEGITPKENLVLSFEGSYALSENLKVK